MKVLLKRFQLNGNTIGFHPQSEKLVFIVSHESTAKEVSFENTIGFHLPILKLELHINVPFFM